MDIRYLTQDTLQALDAIKGSDQLQRIKDGYTESIRFNGKLYIIFTLRDKSLAQNVYIERPDGMCEKA